MNLSRSVDSRTLVTRIADTLRQAVMSGELRPGQRIRQDEFASQLGVSRTPLREAFRVLENEGWLVAEPRHGVEVAPLSAAQAEELALMRLLLEPFAIRIASVTHDDSEEERMDELLASTQQPVDETTGLSGIDEANRKLHFQLYGMQTGLISPALSATLLQYWDRFSRYRQIYWVTDGQLATRSIPDHQHIVSAWRRRDADAAEREVARHILDAAVTLIRRLDPGVVLTPALIHMAGRYDLDLDL
jgi:DNA-binding GntR family transcriptional regulator